MEDDLEDLHFLLDLDFPSDSDSGLDADLDTELVLERLQVVPRTRRCVRTRTQSMRCLKGRDVDLSLPLPLQDILMPIVQPWPQLLLLPPPPPPICQSQCTYSSLEIPHRLPNPQHLYPLPPRLRNRSRVRSQVFDASESPPPYNVDEERRLLFSPSSPAEPSSAEHHHHNGDSEAP